MRKTLKNILVLLNGIASVSLLIACLATVIPPDLFFVPAFFGIIYPIFLAINIVFLLFWLFKKSKFVLLSLLPVILFWNLTDRNFQIFGRKTKQGDIKVLSYNVQHFTGNLKNKSKENADQIIQFLKNSDASIICLQEVRLRTNSVFNLENTVRSLKTIKHYQYARSSITYGSVTLTRYPIINMGEVRFKKSRNITIYTDMVIGKDTVRVFNVHLQSYHIDPRDYSIIEEPVLDEEKDFREVREMGKKMVTAFRLRAEQARTIRGYIDDSPYPVIVCGDFNDTPASFSYHRIRGNLKDAFVSSGKGVGKTYIGILPSFRIDYILHSENYKSYNFQTIDFRLSDHLPVMCILKRS